MMKKFNNFQNLSKMIFIKKCQEQILKEFFFLKKGFVKRCKVKPSKANLILSEIKIAVCLFVSILQIDPWKS